MEKGKIGAKNKKKRPNFSILKKNLRIPDSCPPWVRKSQSGFLKKKKQNWKQIRKKIEWLEAYFAEQIKKVPMIFFMGEYYPVKSEKMLKEKKKSVLIYRYKK